MALKNLIKDVCNERVFSSLFEKHAVNLHNYLFYKYGDNLNPKDKVQEAFIKLWENCGKVPPEKARAFLLTVANNLMLNEFAHQKVVLRYKNIPKQNHTNITPEFLLEEKEYLEKLERAITKLTEKERVAFLMNRIEGKRHKEIAEILGIGTKAVEKRIYSALKKIRIDIKEI